MTQEKLAEIRKRAEAIGYDCYGLDHEVTPAAVEQLVDDRKALLDHIAPLLEENRKLRQIIADVMFREMTGLTPVLRTGEAAWAEIEPKSGESPKCPCGMAYLRVDGGYVPVCACAARNSVTPPPSGSGCT